MIYYFLAALGMLALDRASKIWAHDALSALPGGLMSAWEGVFQFHYAQNTGAAFSFLNQHTGLITAATAVLLAAALGYLIWAKPRRFCARAGLLMIVAGGLGNLYDRVAHGFVIDFIEPTFVQFAVFNLADVFICAGAALAALGILLSAPKEKKSDGLDH